MYRTPKLTMLKMKIEVALIFPLFLLVTLTACQPSSGMSPARKQFISELIATMNLRKYGTNLDTPTAEAYEELILQKYFDNGFYKKFVIAYESYVKPKLVLNEGDSCDPSYTDDYKQSRTGFVTSLSLAKWANDHVPDKLSGKPNIDGNLKYCDFRKGLVCDTSKRRCSCPTGASMKEIGGSPNASRVCLIDRENECRLIDLKNSEATEMILIGRLSHLIFNPERPVSCSPGTSCRFKAPFLERPRCWCSDLSAPDCNSATVVWLPPGQSLTSQSGVINLGQVLQSIWDRSLGFQAREERDSPFNGTAVSAREITPKMKQGLASLHSLDEHGVGEDINHIKSLQAKSKNRTFCWKDLNPEYTCQARQHEVTKTGSKYVLQKSCECSLNQKKLTLVDGLEWKAYGSPCHLEVDDLGGGCEPNTICYRWDTFSPTGTCYCPSGYQTYNGVSECTSFVPALANLVHPTTVILHNFKLSEIQTELRSLDEAALYITKTECFSHVEEKWKQVYKYFTSLIDARESDEVRLVEKLQLFRKIIEDSPSGALCDLKNGWECVSSITKPGGKSFCEKNATSRDLTQITQSWGEISEEMDNDLFNSMSLFEAIHVPEEVDCKSECGESSICVDDYSASEALSAIWTVTHNSTGALIQETRTNHDATSPRLSSDEVASLSRCERQVSQTRCQCTGGGQPSKTLVKPCGAPRKYTDCERVYLEAKKDALVHQILTESGALHCNLKAEVHVDNAIRLLDDDAPDLYQIVGELRASLKLTQHFCDRTKMLKCYDADDDEESSPYCDCADKLKRRKDSSGLSSAHCYLTEGHCSQDMTEIIPHFPSGKSRVRSHYGDHLNPGDLDAQGCLRNACLGIRDKHCVGDVMFDRFRPLRHH